MKNPLLSLSAGAVALALPLHMVAAYTSPSALFWAWTGTTGPQDATAEFHVQVPKEQVYVSVWSKGVQEAGLSLQNDGSADITIDVVAPMENLNARLKMSVMAVDGMAYMKLNSISGTMDQEIAAFSAQITGKRWIMLPAEETIDMTGDDPFEAIAEHLAMNGMETSGAELRQLVGDVLDAGFSVHATKIAGGNEYMLSPKRGFVNDIAAVIMAFHDQEDMPAMMSVDESRKLEREILKQLKMGMSIRTDAQDKPTSMSAWMTFKSEDGDVVAEGKIGVSPHKGAFSVMAPTDAMTFEAFVESLGGDVTMFGQPFSGFEENSWEAAEPTWEEDTSWSNDGMGVSSCEGMTSMQYLAAVRKGLCGDQRDTRPRTR